MKQLSTTILFTLLMSMVGTKATAHDFAVANADGVTIYYINNGDNTVSVSCRGTNLNDYANEYSGRVVIPASVNYKGKTYRVTQIGNGAFANCNVTYVYIPNGITQIKTCAFSGCSGLTSIRIPSSMTYIGESAFNYCSGLTYIVFGNTTTTISDDVFDYCENITDVYCYSQEVPAANFDTFGYYDDELCYDHATLHVPKESLAQYHFYSPWASFSNIVAIESTDDVGLPSVNSDGQVCFDILGQPISNPRKGIYIIRQKDGLIKKLNLHH